MRRPAVVVALAAAVLVAGAGLAAGAFTNHRSTPQHFAAADSFRPPDRHELGAEAESKTNDGGASSSQILFGLRLRNTGGTRIDLNSVTIRYWYTTDESGADPHAECYYATLGCNKVKMDVVLLEQAREGANRYLEVSFQSGRLDPGEVAELNQLGVVDLHGGTYDQQDDYSFKNVDTFTNNVRVTVYHGRDLVWGTEPELLPIVETVEVQYANRDSDPHDSAILPSLQVVDTGTVDIELADLTLRYWFSKDTESGLRAFCDYADIKCKHVETSFVPVAGRPRVDTYLEVGFDPGVLQIADSTGVIQLRLQHSDHGPFDETDDYSHGTNTAFEPTVTVTAYLKGRLIWGTEP